MTYRPPERCERCRGRVFQQYGDFPRCLDCGWWDHGMPLRIVNVGIPLELPGFEDVAVLIRNHPEGEGT